MTALVSRGCTDRQIAAEIETTEQILKTYLERILDKTGCWNRTEVALWYLRFGIETEGRFYDRRAEANWETTERRKAIVVILGRHRPEQMSSMSSTWRSDAGLERGFGSVAQLRDTRSPQGEHCTRPEEAMDLAFSRLVGTQVPPLLYPDQVFVPRRTKLARPGKP
jgi:hypothetical protein